MFVMIKHNMPEQNLFRMMIMIFTLCQFKTKSTHVKRVAGMLVYLQLFHRSTRIRSNYVEKLEFYRLCFFKRPTPITKSVNVKSVKSIQATIRRCEVYGFMTIILHDNILSA